MKALLVSLNGSVGAYQKLRGVAFGEVDPADPQNAVLTDIELVSGKVTYTMDIYILRPVNLDSGNRKLFDEVNNRGNKLFGPFNLSGGGNNPTTAADAGGAMLMNQGYAIAWNGWDISATAGGDRLTITVPTVANRDGSVITGPSYEYIVFDNATTLSSTLAYPAASTDKSKATLTVRDHITAVSFELWRDRYLAPNALISGHTCCRAASSAFPVGSPFASLETYCDRPLFEHHT